MRHSILLARGVIFLVDNRLGGGLVGFPLATGPFCGGWSRLVGFVV